MYDNNPAYDGQSVSLPKRVFFTGTTALRKGQGLVYAANSGTATSVDGNRLYKVTLPTSGTNGLHFAGVAKQDYTANANGQSIEIDTPGSNTQIAITQDSTLQSGTFHCIVSSDTGIAGLWTSGTSGSGYAGPGAAIPLQTNASGTLATSMDGSATVSGTTLTKSSAFGSVSAGNKVIIYAGATTNAAAAIRGIYTIASVTSANAVELTASAGTGNVAFSVYDHTAPPTAQAYLIPGGSGRLSGFVSYLVPLANGAAESHMTSGTNIVIGGCTIGTADSTATLADGTFIGQRVRFVCTGTLTTNDYQLTVTTGKQLDGSTALAGLEFDAAADQSDLEWLGPHWKLLMNSGPTIS